MKVVPQSAIQMSVYDTMKDLMLSRQPGIELSNPQRLFAGAPTFSMPLLLQSMLCMCDEHQAGKHTYSLLISFHGPTGFSAGAVSTAATYPLEALRTHISLGRQGGYVAIARDIVRERVRATVSLASHRNIRQTHTGHDITSRRFVSSKHVRHYTGSSLQCGLQGMRGLYQGFGACMANTAVTVACVALACRHISDLVMMQRQLLIAVLSSRGLSSTSNSLLTGPRLGFTSYEVGVDVFRKFHDGQKPDPGAHPQQTVPRHAMRKLWNYTVPARTHKMMAPVHVRRATGLDRRLCSDRCHGGDHAARGGVEADAGGSLC